MQIGLAFIDSVVIEEVSLPLWRELFDAVGWPASLAGKATLTHDDVLSSFDRDTPSDDLLQALEALHDLGTPEGRETIGTLLIDRQIPPGTLPQDMGEREFALKLFLQQREDGALAEVFSRAQVQVQEGNHRRFNDFIGQKPKHIRDLAKKRQALENAVRDYCRAHDLGDHVQIRDFEDDDGVCRFQIMRSHHTRTPLAVVPGSAARAKIQYRPVHADLVRYEPALGRLRITARAASIVGFYQRCFGKVLFGDEAFFDGDPVCSLRVLQERGRLALASHNIFGVGRVWMTECVWERGDRRRLTLQNTDCFDEIEALKLPLTEGQIVQAKLKIEVIGKSRRPVIATVRVPSRIEVSQAQHEHLVNEVLAAVGIRDAHARPPEHDLWSLYPWSQPVTSWRDCFGAGMDALVHKGVLAKIQLSSIEPAAHPGAGHVLVAERVSATAFYGVSQAPEIPSQSLSATDLDGLELKVPALQAHLREVMGITGNAAPWAVEDWLLDLGVLTICKQDLRLFYALREPPPGAAADVRKRSASATPVLLLPRGLPQSTGLNEVLLDGAIPDAQRAVRDIIAAADLTARASGLLTAPAQARLIVDSEAGTVWFDRVEIPDLKPGTQPYRFVEFMARRGNTTVSQYEVVEHLSAGRQDGTQTARSAKNSANRAIRAALRVKGIVFDDPFPSSNGSYRLAVLSHVR